MNSKKSKREIKRKNESLVGSLCYFGIQCFSICCGKGFLKKIAARLYNQLISHVQLQPQPMQSEDEFDIYISKLDRFFDCASKLADGRNAAALEDAFDIFRAFFENLIAFDTPLDEL